MHLLCWLASAGNSNFCYGCLFLLDPTMPTSSDPVIPQPQSSTAIEPIQAVLEWVDRCRWWVFALIAGFYLLGYTGSWPVSSDSALYAALGRNIWAGHGYVYNGEHHTWVEPGTPLMVALSFAIGGAEAFWPVMAMMVALSLVCLALFYQIVRLNFGRPTAVLLTALLAFTETFYRYGYFLFTDVPLLTVVLLFLLGYELIVHRPGRFAIVCGWTAITAGSFLMPAIRPVWPTLLAGFAIGAVWQIIRDRQRWTHVAILMVVIASVLAFRAVDPRRSEVEQSTYMESHVSSMATEHRAFVLERMVKQHGPQLFERTVPQALVGIQLIPGVNSIFSLVVLGLGTALFTWRPTWAPMIGATVAQLLFFLPRERYLLPVLPLLLIAIWKGIGWLLPRVPVGRRNAVLVVIGGLFLVPNMVAIGKHIFERHREASMFASYTLSQDDKKEREIPAIAKALREKVAGDALVLTAHDRELHYFSGVRTMPPMQTHRIPPTDAQISKFGERLARERELYMVLPNKGNELLIERIGLSVGDAEALAAGLSLHRVHFRSVAQ